MAASVDNPGLPIPDAAQLSTAPALRSFFLSGPAGRLEALLNAGNSDAPFAVLLCHPHPLGGGTMHNKVVYHAMKVFHGMGWPVLRFNFRGAGLSEGRHDGQAEVEDVHAGLHWLREEFGKPIVAAGFSFGAAMSLSAARGVTGLAGLAALGLPTHAEGRDYRYPFLAQIACPKLFLSGAQDQYAPADQLRAVVATAAEPKKLVLVPDAGHFFTGHLPAMQVELAGWLNQTFPAAPGAAHPPAHAATQMDVR